MTKISPFKAIVPNHLSIQTETEGFYCCRIKNQYFESVGLVCAISATFLGKTIFGHERPINLKISQYIDSFNKYSIQFAPVTLIYQGNHIINSLLKQVVDSMPPLFSAKDKGTIYEVWKIENCKNIRNLYKKIGCFLIADGHHRVLSLKLWQKDKLFSAILIADNSVYRSNILRLYHQFSENDFYILKTFLERNFTLRTLIPPIYESMDNFYFKFQENFIEIKSSSTYSAARKILEFLDKNFNYNGGELNFYNRQLTLNSHENFNDSLNIVIPQFKLKSSYSKSHLLPPHSTLFYPKIPKNLISLNLLEG